MTLISRAAIQNAWRNRRHTAASIQEGFPVEENLTQLQSEDVSTSTTDFPMPVRDGQVSESSSHLHQAVHPCLAHGISNIEGDYQFQVTHPIEENSVIPKGAAWTYSWVLKELFVKMNVDCPFNMQVIGAPPVGTVIRATLYYQRPEDHNNIPKRCLNHSSPTHPTNIGHSAPDYIIRSNIPETVYETDENTGRMSTLFPYTQPESDVDTSTYLIKFMCRTSCSGGMNRRPICVVFTLEHEGKCLGRQVQKVRVCACPGRDRNHEETRLGYNIFERPVQSHLKENVKKACKRISSTLASNDLETTKRSKTYTVNVTSRSVYLVLKDLIPILEGHLENETASNQEEENN